MNTVMIVDDHPLVRAGLRSMIDEAPDFTVIAEASSGQEAIDRVDSEPDIVVMDLSMPQMDGIEATKRMLGTRPRLRIVVLTSFHDSARVVEVMRAGAVGYLLKDSDPAEILQALRAAAAGHLPLDARVTRALLTGAESSARPILSAREEQVLRLIAQGLSNKQIGFELQISERTVKAHVGNLFRRISVADRTSAAMWFRDNPPASSSG